MHDLYFYHDMTFCKKKEGESEREIYYFLVRGSKHFIIIKNNNCGLECEKEGEVGKMYSMKKNCTQTALCW